MNQLNPKIKIYIAAPWKNKEEAKAAKKICEDAGLEVTSRWIELHGDKEKDDPTNIKYFEEEATHDVQDVYRCDILILLNIQKSEGKAAETGMAMAWGKPVILVGERSNIFHYLPVPKVSNLNAAIELIRQWESDYYENLAKDSAGLAVEQAAVILEETVKEANGGDKASIQA